MSLRREAKKHEKSLLKTGTKNRINPVEGQNVMSATEKVHVRKKNQNFLLKTGTGNRINPVEGYDVPSADRRRLKAPP